MAVESTQLTTRHAKRWATRIFIYQNTRNLMLSLNSLKKQQKHPYKKCVRNFLGPYYHFQPNTVKRGSKNLNKLYFLILVSDHQVQKIFPLPVSECWLYCRRARTASQIKYVEICKCILCCPLPLTPFWILSHLLKGQQREMVFWLNLSHIVQLERI